MRIQILAVGRIKEKGFREAIDDYIARTSRHFAVQEDEVRDAPPDKLAPLLDKRLSPGHAPVALDMEGKAFTSVAFARWLEKKALAGTNVTFLIGGAEGLPPQTLVQAREKLSLSAMTLPHRLARLLLAEQLYRAVTILRGEPYARV